MKNDDIKKLALSLAEVDTEKKVVSILKKLQLWGDDSAWREYGDTDVNYSTIGNQQSYPDNALVEKIVNSVDAVMMRECLRQGIKPEGKNAPQSITGAQEKFFKIYNGKLSSISAGQRTALAENISLVATGGKVRPSLAIIDKGEGQTPERIPETLLSLTKNNKIKIPFVQGKFGMGGSGVLRFCSPLHQLQLVISKRDPEIYDGEEESPWGVTVVRREDPKEGMRTSHCTYLAPGKNILSFCADDLPLLPRVYPDALGNSLRSGTYIKLYEYEIGPGLRSQIEFELYYRLALLMPALALPVRMFERRTGYKAHTHEKTLAGLSVRLDEDKSENLEKEFQTPSTGEMTIEGQKVDYSIYAFKKGKKENYARKDGVIFSVNGQAHGSLPKNFFERKSVGMSYLADSILVTIDCSRVSPREQEKLFMPSRDRLAGTPFRSAFEKKIESEVKNHQGLRALQNRRRQEALEDKLTDAKPMVEVIEKIIKKSPTLSSLFLSGVRIKNPFSLKDVGDQDDFEGKRYPSYFSLKKKYSKQNPKQCHIKRRFRIQYETDAENDYFNRDSEPGELTLRLNGDVVQDYSLNLWNGLATLTITLPGDVGVGDVRRFEVSVSDATQVDSFSSDFFIRVIDEVDAKGTKSLRKKPPSDKAGKDRQKEAYLDMPEIIEIRREDWAKEEYGDFRFSQDSALKVRSTGEGNGYDFFINMDNACLKNEMKAVTKIEPEILEARYKFGMVLLGISILDFDTKRQKEDQESDKGWVAVDEKVSQLTEALSPILLPMISSLGDADFGSE
ncbi:hypothetical protein ACFL0Z_02485 [Patescibacteria group bacterium]